MKGRMQGIAGAFGRGEKQMKKILVFLMIGLMVAGSATVVQAKSKSKSKKASKAQASQPVTHPQLADTLVKALGLMTFLPNAPTAQQEFDVLMQNGISPEKGWLLDAIVTKADLSRVLVQAMRKEDDVENPNDPQSWIDTLKEAGISLNRLSETVQSIEVLPDAMGQDLTLGSSDPLVYGVNFAPGSSIQYSVDLNMVTRVLSEQEMVSGEFRPINPTPY
jgi:hypothetical protein